MDIELAWAAGFYDGEGSVSCTSNNGNPYTRIQLSIGQKDRHDGSISESLIRFINAVGVGKIYRKTKTGKEINQHQYLVCKKSDVEFVLSILWPYISETKRNQAERAIALLSSGIERLMNKREVDNESV
jgi:hypothetical protein